ncbi:TPA: RidA family protein [Enterococcus faecium]
MNKIIRNNPKSMPNPVGNYSHITKVPRNAELFVLSGQIGTDKSGNLSDSFNDQVTQAFNNIQHALASEQLDLSNIIKVNIWSIEEIDWDFFYDKWGHFFANEEYPSMTIGYISALGLPKIKIEIEVWAAKP